MLQEWPSSIYRQYVLTYVFTYRHRRFPDLEGAVIFLECDPQMRVLRKSNNDRAKLFLVETIEPRMARDRFFHEKTTGHVLGSTLAITVYGEVVFALQILPFVDTSALAFS